MKKELITVFSLLLLAATIAVTATPSEILAKGKGGDDVNTVSSWARLGAP